MNTINLNKNLSPNSLEVFMHWLEPDILKINQTILDNLVGSASLITDLSSHIINSGGKRIRPLLTIACSKLCKYTGNRHIPLASAVEFIHTATLLHDDVVDNSKKRRGKSTANFIWDNKSSILVGDYLLSKAFRMLINDGSLKCLDIISQASIKISHGEVKQLVSIKNLHTSESEYLDIITHKTAELFSAACQIGGEISEIDSEKKKSLEEFGIFLGIAYQIIDDTLDYFSNFNEFGKNTGNDLKEGKMSLPLILCYKRCNKVEKKIIEYVISKDQCENNDFEKVVDLMNKYNVKMDCVKKAYHFSTMAKDSLGSFSKSTEKERLINLLDHLVQRTS
ncbi:MAG: polyprenyl synthetase family protein [Alphaproteobacteria bacterium]